MEKTHFNIKITNRCNQLLLSLRDSWFPNEEDPMPNEEDPMPVEDFIYVICCSLIYNKPKKKK
jgi:hypothetical protein